MDHADNQDRSADLTTPDDQLSPGAWLARNGAYLALFAALLVVLYHFFGLDGMWNLVKAGLGLGFVIFIHELGHFAVAKWCDVHVQTFSIGFGPALPGCSFRWGETTYKLALFPLGGYVKMVGEGGDDPGSEDDPRSFKNKPVGQRMAIISAGVIMNVVLAFVCFIAVFSHGKERDPAVAGTIDSGGLAFEKGIPSGADFLQIGSKRAEPNHPLYFTDLQAKVALSSSGEQLTFVWRDPRDGKVYSAEIEPRRGKHDLRPMIGLAPPESLELRNRELLPDESPYPVKYQSAAAAARPAAAFQPGDVIVAMTDPDNPAQVTPLRPAVPVGGRTDPKDLFELSQRWQRLAGEEIIVRLRRDGAEREVRVPPGRFEPGDTVIATTDPDNPAQVTPIPEDPRYPGSGMGNVFVFQQRLERLAGQFLTVRVRRANGEEHDLLVPPAYHVTLGVHMQMGTVANIREGSPGARAGIRPGDLLTEVRLSTADGSASQRFVIAPPRKGGKNAGGADAGVHLIDPMRLPDALRRWAEAHEKEGVKVKLVVLRDDPQTHEARKREELAEVEWDFRWRFDRVVPIGIASPVPVPELGIAYRVETTVAEVVGPPASDGLRKNDVVKAVRFRKPGKNWGASEDGSWVDKLESDQWPAIFFELQRSPFKELTLRVERDGKTEEVRLTAQPVPDWPMAERGWLWQPAKVIQKADNFVEAMGMGLEDTWRGLTQVYLFIRGMMPWEQRLSPKNLGGPITIGIIAYKVAAMDFWEFLFFLGMISINLAAFNFLPIPVLDGGHMVFLVYEKLRGKQASEAVQWGAVVVGLVSLGLLMLFVLWQDLVRWVLHL
ncbi:MAG TPA: site-2 protease family protein [Gemmataceae bacterium]|nr:site-2 protease family protein [Gemmataceae bacterium]